MAASNTIREFLVGLGYRIDESSARKFDDSIVGATKNVLKLGLGIEGLVLAAETATVKMASSFERMYYQSQRTGASIKNINEFAYAITQVGGKSDAAKQSVEGLANFLRSNPGAGNFLKRLGIDGLDRNGKMKDTVALLTEIGDKLKAMPFYRAKIYAGLFGIDDDTLIAMTRDTAKFRQEYDQLYRDAGVNQEDLGRKSSIFMQSIRYLGQEINAIWEGIYQHLLDKYGPELTRFTERLKSDVPTITSNINHLADALFLVSDGLEKILGYANKLDNAFPDWIKKAVEFLFPNSPTMQHWLTGNLHGDIDKLPGATTAAAATVSSAASSVWSQFKNAGAAGKSDGGAGVPSPRARQTMAFFMSAGLSRANAAGIVGNFIAESGLDPHVKENSYNKGHQGIGQWDERRQADFKSFSGKDIRDSTYEDQLKFTLHELQTGERYAAMMLKLTSDPTGSAFAFGRDYERFGDFAHNRGKYQLRGHLAQELFNSTPLGADGSGDNGTSVVINQKTDIHAHGADSGSTAAAVAGAQTSVNQRLIATTRTKLQ